MGMMVLNLSSAYVCSSVSDQEREMYTCCVHVHVCVFQYVCICMYMCMCLYAHVFVCACVYFGVCVYACFIAFSVHHHSVLLAFEGKAG